jgi:3-oxoacyl-[acyl-carrier-protein] synthase-3
MTGLKIKATGRAVPAKIVTNDDYSRTLDTSDEWIRKRTGIASRYICEEEKNYELATRAASLAIERAGIQKEEIGAVIVATFSGDYATPAVACLVQRDLGLRKDIPVFDLNAACSGFLYGLKVSHGLFHTISEKYILLIGSEQISRYLDFTDRSTCVLFGDGAGAAVLERTEDAFYCEVGADGNDTALYCKGTNYEDAYVHMDGQGVFRFAVGAIEQGIETMLAKADITLDQVDYVICHQANRRIIDFVGKKMHIPKEKLYVNVQRYGNTSAASIPLVLDEMMEQKLLTKGTKAICVGFGAGFSWGSALLEF